MLFSNTDFGVLATSAAIVLAGSKGLIWKAVDPVRWWDALENQISRQQKTNCDYMNNPSESMGVTTFLSFFPSLGHPEFTPVY